MYLTASADVDLEQLQSQLEAATPLCYLHKVSSTAELSCLLIIYHQSAREEVLGVLRGFNTSRPDFSSLSGNPAENISALKGQVEAGGKEIDRLTEQLKVMAKNANLLKTGSDMVAMQIDDQNVRQNIFQTQSVFALTGWITADDAGKVKKLLDRYTCYYTLADPQEGDNPPVKLKNNKFVRPYEIITEMYSLPAPKRRRPDRRFDPVLYPVLRHDAGRRGLRPADPGAVPGGPEGRQAG